MILQAPRPFPRRRGFTLVEIMAATGIMLVVILLTLTLTTNVLSSWTRSTGQLQTNHEARIALDLLTSDLETMVIRDRDHAWVEVDYQPMSPSTADTPILYFFSPTLERPRTKQPGNADILGDVCAISYRLDYNNPFLAGKAQGDNPAPIFALYRTVVDAENTFNVALALGDYSPGTNSLSDLWIDGRASDSEDTPITMRYVDEDGIEKTSDLNGWATDQSNFLSANVAEFKVIFWFQDSTGTFKPITTDYDPDKTPLPFVYAGNGLYINGTEELGAKLAYVDVSLIVLGSEGAAEMNKTTTNNGIGYDAVIQQYGEVFTRRINIMSNPL